MADIGSASRTGNRRHGIATSGPDLVPYNTADYGTGNRSNSNVTTGDPLIFLGNGFDGLYDTVLRARIDRMRDFRIRLIR